MTQKLTISQMKEVGVPEWMIERISNWCVNCGLWKDGRCNAGMICNVTANREKTRYGDIEYHFSIAWWMAMQEIRGVLKINGDSV